MVFSSISFLLYFFPFFLLSYYIVPQKFKNSIILIASTLFYAWGAPKFIFILLASTYIDFYLVKKMDKTLESRNKKMLLALSIFLNVGLLAYFKYANFFIENINTLFLGMGYKNIEWTKVILPIGISFYTFQTLTYSIDIYRKIHAPLKRVSDYMLYIIMFPQLIAGPIVRFHDIADQIETRSETNTDRVLGFYRFIIGLSKKVLIANVLGEYADNVLSQDFSVLSSGTAWLGILAYTFQIYFDFSGYSDMAIGIGRMIGFKFPENFNNPYISKSITEFWRRWHMTLGAWMRDYLYIPLGGSKVKNKSRLYFNLWFVFLISGLWHGASWNFVAWGAFHGLFLIIERLFLAKILKKLGKAISIFYTFFITIMGWVIFWIEDFSRAIKYYQRLFAFDFSEKNIIPETEFWLILFFAIFFSFFTIIKKGESIHNKMFFSNYSSSNLIKMSIVIFVLFFLSVASITTANFNPFIYFRF